MAALFDLTPAVKIALILIAVSPVPPILPGKQLKLGGRIQYVYGLLVAASLSAIIFAPLAIEILGRIFQREAHVLVDLIAKVVLLTVLLPLVVGMALRHFAPALAQRIAPITSGLGNVLLLIGRDPDTGHRLAGDSGAHRQRDNRCYRGGSDCGIDRRPFTRRARAGRPSGACHRIVHAASRCRPGHR